MNNNLKYKNKFGTYQRFTDDKGLQNYKNGIVIDHINGEELGKLKAKEIEAIVNYNKGEWCYGEVMPVTARDLNFIKQVEDRNKDWDTPNVKEIDKLNNKPMKQFKILIEYDQIDDLLVVLDTGGYAPVAHQIREQTELQAWKYIVIWDNPRRVERCSVVSMKTQKELVRLIDKNGRTIFRRPEQLFDTQAEVEAYLETEDYRSIH